MVAPFPTSLFPKVARADALLLRRLAHAVDPAAIGNGLAAVEALVGPLRIEPIAVERWPAGAMAAREDVPLVAIVLGDATLGPGLRLALELDPELAGALADRALGAPDGEPRLAPGPATDGERGALTYLAARTLAPLGGRIRVLALVTTAAALRRAVGDGALSAWPIRVGTGAALGWARLWAPDGWEPPDGAPAHRGETELELAIVAGRARLSAGEIARLEVGDVVVPDTISISRAVLGAVELVAPAGGPRIAAELREDGALILGALSPDTLAAGPLRGTVSAAMGKTEPYGDAAGDVPVELRLEIGRVVLRVAELAALRPGEILTTGSAVGARVALRAGDEIVATGELCDVEGELGVRILELRSR